MTFFERFTSWMTTSTSILGQAVATPTVIAALSGAMPWSQAWVPLLGAAVAVLLPQQPAKAIPALTSPPVQTVALHLSQAEQLNAGLHAMGAIVERLATALAPSVPALAPVAASMPTVIAVGDDLARAFDKIRTAYPQAPTTPATPVPVPVL